MHEEVPWWAVAERNQRAFSRAYDALGCLPPDVEPRATGHVPEMIVLMQRLIDSGHAYPSGGDVFFDVQSLPGYGSLSGQRLEHMRPAGDTEDGGAKHDPRDFALWKGAKPGEPTWPTPWGPGRPGWHLECSAMSTKYLGATFDIHGGGLDLLFPHHENEQAQSHAAGDGFARYWLHNGLVRIGGEKMSKSLGNSLLDRRDGYPGPARSSCATYLGQAHYRSPIDYSPAALAESATAYRRIEGFVTRAVELVAASCWAPRLPRQLPRHCPPRSPRRWTTTSAFRRRWRSSTTASGTGTRRWPPATSPAPLNSLAETRAMLSVTGARSARGAVGGGGPGWRPAARRGRTGRGRACSSGRRPGHARISLPLTPSGISCQQAGVLVEDTPRGPRWELRR